MSLNIKTTKTKAKLLISIPTKDLKAEEIAEEIKSAWWKKNKLRVEKMLSEN